MNTKPANKRLEFVDVTRGIGIIAVVIGHVWSSGPIRDVMYSFHMPLFFLLSGYLSQPRPIGPFTWRQLESQMRPYFAFLTSLIAIDQIIEPLKGGRAIFHSWPSDLFPILMGGSELRGPYTIFWFVPCLMIARIAFNAMSSYWPSMRTTGWVALQIGVVGFAYALGNWSPISPLGLATMPMAFFLLWVGSLWRGVKWRAWMWVPLAPLSVAGLSLWLPTLNMKAADYGMPIVSIAAAIATCLLIMRVARGVGKMMPFLADFGRASLVIMYCHVALIHYLSPYLGKELLAVIALLGPYALQKLLKQTSLKRVFL